MSEQLWPCPVDRHRERLLRKEIADLRAQAAAQGNVIAKARAVLDAHKRCPEWRTEHFCEWSGCGQDVYELEDALAEIAPTTPTP